MSNWKRFIAAFDVHGDMQDRTANDALFRFMSKWQPDVRVFGGDLWDFRALRTGASEDEKRESMRKDFELGMEWLEKFTPHFFMQGNHDIRLWEHAESGKGAISDYAQIGVDEIEAKLKEMECKLFPYHKRDGILRVGHLKVLHGFACGIYASRQHALVYGSCLFGHTHAIDEHAIPGLERRVARNCGCLCRLDMEYNSRHMNTLKQTHGWAYGVVNSRTGNYHCWQAEKVNGSWMLPSDIVEL